jgi:hypothetical protein
MSPEPLVVFLFFLGVLPARPPYSGALAKSDSGSKVSGYVPVSVCIRQRPREREREEAGEREREIDREREREIYIERDREREREI